MDRTGPGQRHCEQIQYELHGLIKTQIPNVHECGSPRSLLALPGSVPFTKQSEPFFWRCRKIDRGLKTHRYRRNALGEGTLIYQDAHLKSRNSSVKQGRSNPANLFGCALCLACDSISVAMDVRRHLCSLVVSWSVYAAGVAGGEGPRPELLTKPSTSCANSSCFLIVSQLPMRLDETTLNRGLRQRSCCNR